MRQATKSQTKRAQIAANCASAIAACNLIDFAIYLSICSAPRRNESHETPWEAAAAAMHAFFSHSASQSLSESASQLVSQSVSECSCSLRPADSPPVSQPVIQLAIGCA